jgi:hypothetical protein
MGRYLNPPTETKEAWLASYAKPIVARPRSVDEHEGYTPACLVDNGAFTACALAYNQAELEAFDHPTDERPKSWWPIPNDLTGQFQ